MSAIMINTESILEVCLTVVGITGWFLYAKSSKKLHKEKLNIEQLKEMHKKDIADIGEGFLLKMRETEVAHNKDLIQKDFEKKELTSFYEDQLSAALLNREQELDEVESLIKNRITEIEKVYQEVIEDQNKSLELYEKYIRNFDAAITLSEKKIKDLDVKGLFSSDDEIGFFFNTVQYLQGALNNFKIEKEILDNEVTKAEEERK